MRDVYLAVNYKADIFHERLGDGANLGVNLHYLHEKSELGTAGALSLLPELDGPLLVSQRRHRDDRRLRAHDRLPPSYGAALTVAGVQHVSHMTYGILATIDHHLLAIEEKPERGELCNAGIDVLEPEVLRFIAPETPLNMPTLVGQVARWS